MSIPLVLRLRFLCFQFAPVILAVALLVTTGVAAFGTEQETSMQAPVTQSTSLKSDTYHGTLVFQDQYGKKWDGDARLEVNGRTFTLTDKWGGQHKGTLVTVVTEQRIPGGRIKFDGDREISIKWTQDEKRPKRMKIINAKGACIVFRFCSKELDDTECKTELKRPRSEQQPKPRIRGRALLKNLEGLKL